MNCAVPAVRRRSLRIFSATRRIVPSLGFAVFGSITPLLLSRTRSPRCQYSTHQTDPRWKIRPSPYMVLAFLLRRHGGEERPPGEARLRETRRLRHPPDGGQLGALQEHLQAHRVLEFPGAPHSLP